LFSVEWYLDVKSSEGLFWGRGEENCGYLDFSTHLLLTFCILLLLCRNGDVGCQTVFPNNFSCWNDRL